MNNPYIAFCQKCGCEIDLRNERNYWRKIEGWERKRGQGGQNHVALRKQLDEFMCTICMEKMKRGVSSGQMSL